MKRKVATIVGVALMALIAGTLSHSVAFGEGNPILDVILEAIRRIDSRVDSLNATVAEQQQQISELQSKFDSLNETLTSRIESLELNQSALAERIAALENAQTPTEEVTFLHDRFDAGLDSWGYWGGSGYVLEWVSGAAKISGDHIYPPVVECGMQKVIDLSEWNETGALLLSFDWRATSNYLPSSVTNAHLLVEDADSGSTLYLHHLVMGGTTDTGWQSYVNDISPYLLGHPSIRIVLYLNDGWTSNWNQTNAYDNIKLTTETSP